MFTRSQHTDACTEQTNNLIQNCKQGGQLQQKFSLCWWRKKKYLSTKY